MKSENYVIIEVDSAYNNEKKIGDVSLVVNSTIESVEHINRIGKVIASPSFTKLKQGDFVIVHHNICRLRNDIRGNQTQSNYHIEGNKYFVPLTEVFAYKREDEWKSFDPYCFIEPIVDEEVKVGSIHILHEEDHYKGRKNRIGIVTFTNEELTSYGINNGDKVAFTEDSEYEFIIDGKVYYKMRTKDITGKFE